MEKGFGNRAVDVCSASLSQVGAPLTVKILLSLYDLHDTNDYLAMFSNQQNSSEFLVRFLILALNLSLIF